MKTAAKADWKSSFFPLLACVALALLGLAYYTGSFKVLTVLCAVLLVLILATHDLSNLRHPAALLLLGYVVVAGFSTFWAISGKFFLKEFSKIFVAACLFVTVLVWRKFSKKTVHNLFAFMSGIAAVYSFLSVEYVTTGVSKIVLNLLIPGMNSIRVYAQPGVRLSGIFDGSNPTATLMALAVIFGIYLMTNEEDSQARMFHGIALSMNAFVLLGLFSMAGLGFFALSILVYLIAAGKQRAKSFVYMLVGAVPTLIWVFASFSFFGAESSTKIIPLFALLANAVTVVVLDRKLAPKLIPILEKHQKLALGSIVGMILLAVVYVIAGMNISTPYTFGTVITRSFYPNPGTHTLSIQASSEVNCIIRTQTQAEAIMTTNTYVYSGNDEEITFEVPEGTIVAYVRLSANPGVTIERAVLDGSKEIALKYPLLPDFVTTRMQGLFAKDSALQRTALFNDGLELFSMKPLTGHGVGSFETAITSVQDFHFETKYIHNHYIQIMEECGLLGIIPFVGSLLCMVYLLWKKRKDDKEDEWSYRSAFAPLCAAFVMVLTHSTFELSMSFDLLLWFAYITFALLIRCCAGEKTSGKKEKTINLVVRIVGIALPVMYGISVCMNMAGTYLMNSPVSSEEQFMRNLATVAEIDPYEYNDAKLSYLVATMQSPNSQFYMDQANHFAAQLEQAQSNTLPKMLVQYYLCFEEYDKMVEAALLGATYSASDPDTWNATTSVLRQSLLAPVFYVQYSDMQGLSTNVQRYYDALCKYNATSMQPVKINLAAMDFFSKVNYLAAGSNNLEEVVATMTETMFRSDLACEADGDNIPDQIGNVELAAFHEDGSISAQAGARFDLSLYSELTGINSRVKVACENPSAMKLIYAGQEIPVTVEDGCAVFNFLLDVRSDYCAVLAFESTHEQTISGITVDYVY